MITTNRFTFSLLIVAALAANQASAHFTLSPNANYNIFWLGSDGENFGAPAPASLTTAGTAFGSTAHPAAAHTIPHVNDGIYGNSNSWLADPGDGAPQIGVALGGSFNVNKIAFGRDNGGEANQFTDRNLGVYTLQRTTVAAPTAGTAVTGVAATGWETIGTIGYNSADDTVVGGAFTPWLRHDFGVTLNGAAVEATGLRILPSANSLVVDELEIYSGTALNAPLRLVGSGGTIDPNNLALQPGATAFASSLLNNGGFAAHQIEHLNDGIAGNSNSWIGDGPADFVGIDLGGDFVIDGIAFGRDSGGEAQQFVDRFLGSYVLEYTTAENPHENTPDSEWNLIGGVSYDGIFPDATGYLRHEFEFDKVVASGIRLHVGPNGLSGGVAIDELEVFGVAVPEPSSIALWLLVGAAFVAFGWRRARRQG